VIASPLRFLVIYLVDPVFTAVGFGFIIRDGNNTLFYYLTASMTCKKLEQQFFYHSYCKIL
jgi:hypothetical protein